MEQTKVLICEDESIVALELQQRLQDFGYQVAGIASRGEEAFALAAQQHPDIALMDVRLNGDLSGPEIATILSKDYNIPSIYLSAYGDEETVKEASRAEPLGYLIKPVRDQELDFSIRFGLAQHRAQKELKEKVARNNKKLEKAETILNEMSVSLAREIRMRGLQDLVGGIAHYFNNSIMSISGFLEFIRDTNGLQPFQVRQIRNILKIYAEQKLFVKRLLWVSGNTSLHLAFQSLQDAVSAAIANAIQPNKTKINVSTTIPEKKLMAYFDSEAIIRALTNVIENAVEAVGNEGTISIILKESYEEMPEQYNRDAVPGKYYVITVQDTGPGITSSIINKITEPFYTTKIERLATGLGLSEAYGIFQAHEGWIEISSQPQVGTTIQMFLPDGATYEH